MDVHPAWSNGDIYKEFKTYLVIDPDRRRHVENVIRRQKLRWRDKRVTVRIDVPDIRDIRKTKKKTISLKKNAVKKTLEGIIDNKLIDQAPLRPDKDAYRGRATTHKMAKKDVRNVLTQRDAERGGHFVDSPPPPSGRIYAGERWRFRDADGEVTHDNVTSYLYEECWEVRRGYWWDEWEGKWHRGAVPGEYRYYY